MKTMRILIGMMAVFMAVNAVATDPTISDVVVRQRWPWSKLVDIDYVLTADPTQRVDVAVNAYNGSVSLTLPTESLSGDLYGVSEGLHRIVWDPTVTTYTNNVVLTKFRVGLVQTPVPIYMIVDLTKSAGADGQIEYIYLGDSRLVTEGRYTNVWFGVTNDSVYATDKLVLRRVPAGSFTMGGNGYTTSNVKLTKDFYVGVFEVTQRQWERVMNVTMPAYFNNPTFYATRPLENQSYIAIRGASNNLPSSVNWPATGYAVSPASFMGKLRNKAGIFTFDLPTDAQWEYVCRAGTTSCFNDGNMEANVTGVNANTNGWLNMLARYKYNGGYPDGVTAPLPGCGATNGTASVGSYAPNAWGLYDTHGNVWEWVLDWLRGVNNPPPSGTDPVGLMSASARMRRGGSYDSPATDCRPVSLGQYTQESYGKTVGFRIVRVFP